MAVRRYICLDCRLPVERKPTRRKSPRCVPCSIAYSQESARQLAAHKGPIYDQWVAANLAAAYRMLASPAPGEWPLAI